MTATAAINATSGFKLPEGYDNLFQYMDSLEAFPLSVRKTMVETPEMVETSRMEFGKFLTFYQNHYDEHDDQRDHEARANAGKLKHVESGLLPPHTVIVFTEYQGKYQICDGNGRAYLWNDGLLPMAVPSHITVVVLHCKTEEEYRGSYDCYDSPVSKKSSTDDMASAIKRAGLKGLLTQSRFTTGKFKSLPKYVLGVSNPKREQMANVLRARQVGLLSLNQLDLINSPQRFPSFLLVAAVELLNDPRNAFAMEYIKEVYTTVNTLDEVHDEGIQRMLELAALDYLDLPLSGAGCFRGNMSGEKPVKMAAAVIAYYKTVYAIQAGKGVPTPKPAKKKVA